MKKLGKPLNRLKHAKSGLEVDREINSHIFVCVDSTPWKGEIVSERAITQQRTSQ